MRIRAHAVALGAMLAAVVLAVPADSYAQEKKKETVKLDKAQQQEVQTVVKIVDDVVAGQPAPSDFPMTVQFHYQKARDKRTFMPLTIAFPADQVTNSSMVYYVRVVGKAAATPAVDAADKTDGSQEAKKGRPEYPFEDVRFLDLKAPESGQHHVMRAISLPAGEFDVYLLMRERTPKDKKAPAAKGALLKQSVTVPDYWSGELMTSSVLLSNKAEQLTAPPTEADIAANPYIFGMTRVTPSLDNKFSKKDELSIIFVIYNTAAAQGGKPDVKVEYNFYQKAGGADKFFNRTEPQVFNGTTLPPQFDAAAGHQLVGGLSIPLASFPEGEYRLEIKVIDAAAGNKTKTENVALTIVP